MGFFDKILGSSKNEHSSTLEWLQLLTLTDLNDAIERSVERPVALFKHSTRCSISSMAKNRLERNWNFEKGQGPEMYYLDLISYREISNAIADELAVEHESPQILLLKNKEVIYHGSHSAISVKGLQEALAQ